jgi:hypothetical protein
LPSPGHAAFPALNSTCQIHHTKPNQNKILETNFTKPKYIKPTPPTYFPRAHPKKNYRLKQQLQVDIHAYQNNIALEKSESIYQAYCKI